MTVRNIYNTAPYCGDPPMTLGRLFRRDSGGGVPALFKGRDVHWSFNTRVAIRAACDLLQLTAGDEVLAPAYNCGSELDPLIHAGLFVTLYPMGRDAVADPDVIAARITPRTRAIYVTHYFGFLQPRLDEIRTLCDARGLRLIEDCALSLLSGKRPAEGRTGDVSVFCLYKFFPVLAGGALVINAADLDRADPFGRAPPWRRVAKDLARSALAGTLGVERARATLARLRGRARENAAMSTSSDGARPDIPAHYYFDPDLRGSRISFFASRPIRAFDTSETIAARRINWRVFQQLLHDVPGAKPLFNGLPPDTCPLSMPVLVANRDQIATGLQARGIAATPWWAGFNRHLDWSGQADASYLKDNVLSLPLHQFLGTDHISYIVASLQEVMRAGGSDRRSYGAMRLNPHV